MKENKNKHMTFQDRIEIQEGLYKGKTFKERSIMDSVPNRSWLKTKHLTATRNNAFCTVKKLLF